MQEERSYFQRNPLMELLKKFGLMLFKDHIELVTPLRHDFIKLHKENCALKEQIASQRKIVDVVDKAIVNIKSKMNKNTEYTTFIVEHYDPHRFIESSYSRQFPTKEAAIEAYEEIKNLDKPHGHQAELTLYRKVTLRTTRAKNVQGK